MTVISEKLNPSLITATTTIKSTGGSLAGIFVSAAASTPTITIYDGTSTSGTKIVETFTPVAATYYQIPALVNTGLHVVISGTVSATVLWS
jgi:dolichol kinase